MKSIITFLRDHAAVFWARLRVDSTDQKRFAVETPPLRAELFSAEQMEIHGKSLAASHRLSSQRAPDRLLGRLADNENQLLETCKLLTTAVDVKRPISPAGEWLLDNFYLIEEQIRTARRHFPRGYSRELPRLVRGASSGLPRVYDMALEVISHGDGRVDPESLRRFIAAYQLVDTLNLGELWAIPIMLRLALIENLRRVSTRVAASTKERDSAAAWADQMMEIAEREPKGLILVVADMARSHPPMSSPFVAEFARRLQGQSAALALPLTWMTQRLAETGLTIEQMVQLETQKQASAQVSIANSVGSLRYLESMDWREFVEAMSGVEQKLREDPEGAYEGMDFATRDHYRHAVEKIARRSRLSEVEVARSAIQLAHEAASRAAARTGTPYGAAGDRGSHVGYYLVDKGLSDLKRAVHARLSILETLQLRCQSAPLLLYLGAIAGLTTLFAGGMSIAALDHGMSISWLAPMALLAAVCASQLSIALVNWAGSVLVPPRFLPRMDFSKGIPPRCHALVVVPTMLASPESIEALCEALEVRFLANRDNNLQFALLTDFADARVETLPEDELLLLLMRTRIEGLNKKYDSAKGDGPSGDKHDTFFLFHRPRRWNAREQLWMGYERKRGKLADLNAWLRGNGQERFSLIVGNTAVLASVKYVITLDTDTQLPRDSARQFVGVLAHPLNRACLDENRRVVDEGYGIVQPRVAGSLPGANRSRYAKLFGSDSGIDPYTRTVSDVYQDLFGAGSFIGKGIYDIDAFETSLNGRFPENRILSHDLLESCYARSALLSDVQLYEEYPGRYDLDVSRRHRWIRGDWQIASWMMRNVPAFSTGPGKASEMNPLSVLSQWKILDNLRRSLSPAALLLLLVLGWTALSPAWFWTAVVLAIIVIPPLIASIHELVRVPDEMPFDQHLRNILQSASSRFAQSLLELACLPYEAFISLDAIARTNWRLALSHKRLLEWTPSDLRQRENNASLAAYYSSMWAAPVIAAGVAAYLAALAPESLAAARWILLLWLVSPAIMCWLSQPIERREAKLMPEQLVFLRKIARKTWAFFEKFVGPGDHWLPPDNYQEHPLAVVAHRTSPTNMGLSLLANLTAYDFGYIPASQLLERTENAFQTMVRLERYQGHFYNWYDTQTLRVLPPLYVSSVDSGNLAGHLLTLRPGLLNLIDDRISVPRLFDGLLDTFGVLADCAATASGASLGMLALLRKDLETAYDARPSTIGAVQARLEHLLESIRRLSAVLSRQVQDETPSDALEWAQAMARQCSSALDDLALLAPWAALRPESSEFHNPLDALEIPSLRELASARGRWAIALEERLGQDVSPAEREWIVALRKHVETGAGRARERIAAIERLARQASELASIQYDFLNDKSRHLLVTGYNVTERREDSSSYDLLASEARLSCFVGIALGQLPQESWFALGRQLTTTGGEPILLSWSGSMFEYLMPLLVMPTYENTLLDGTCKAAVERQIVYGLQRGVAWGISECGYNTVDASFNYQYRAFGVPGLGFKRGLAEDLVIAPYASALALMVAPEDACANLERLSAEGLEGKYGFYEAVDYTASRLPRGQSSVTIRSFMAHHQGMIFLSLAYLLLDRPMQKRFESDPMFQATCLLLQERVPKTGIFTLQASAFISTRAAINDPEMPVRVFNSANTPVPETQLLSNGRYHVMVTNAGGGYSRWRDLSVTRWREDPTCDNWGAFCYLRDVASGTFWSNTHQPTRKLAQSHESIFSEGRAEFRRRDLDYETHTEMVVSPEDDIELRRLRITNRARVRRTIEVTSYAEVVLADPAADALHPAFSNLFVQTEIIGEQQAILCTRRPRSSSERPPWMFHLMAVRGAGTVETSYETDRLRFIGRGRDIAAPLALIDSRDLSGASGSVLDPIVAIRSRMTLDPDQVVTIDLVTGIAASREAAMGLTGKYRDWRLADRVFELAWTHSQVVLRQINASESDAQLFGRLAGSVIYANSRYRADADVIARNRRGQSGLWGYSISGDLPIVLLQIGKLENIELVRQLVQAHAYWRLKGLTVDLVIWNEDRAGYRQLLQDQIMGLIAAGIEAHVIDRPGGIFVRRAEQISDEDRILVQSVARVMISDRRGGLGEQINRRATSESRAQHLKLPRLKPVRAHRAEFPAIASSRPSDLLFDNGLGGFSPDGREYVITTSDRNLTPAPWVNILANPHFGTVISEHGSAYTWSENAHEFRLTPWGNDPVSDSSGEAFYLRDEESAHFWSPAPWPCRGKTPYVTRHGFGCSSFDHSEDGIDSTLTVFVALDAAVKFSILKLHNRSDRSRQLSITGYVEWVLGDLRTKSAMHVTTEIDTECGAVCARNAYNTEFAERVAFFDADNAAMTFTGDRAEFIGRNGGIGNPEAMGRTHLSNKLGAALDPCAAIQVAFELHSGEEREFVFRLGSGRSIDDVRKLLASFRGGAAPHDELEKVLEYWRHTLGAIQVETPDRSLDVLTNGWLVYQTLACRLWGRSGYYQSGGAFGFRDQLQDVMALVHAKPALVRQHLVYCAAHQYREGDVQHWWHPTSGRGVRTHCSDDFLWLPFALCRYVSCTGDTGVLDESIPFLEGRAVNPGEDSYYDQAGRSDESADFYQHAVRAILRGLRFGERGLPLMGSGDWNDGMNMVGVNGKGESVWLGFFLYSVLWQFAKLATHRGDSGFAERCRTEADTLRRNIERAGWDGGWYRRAFFDDGTPLGSAANTECRIDAIAQSWSVLSGAGDPKRARTAMAALNRHLVRRDHSLIQLLDPPFDKSELNPGYIKGYVPGVRENGGQYTHSAIWTVMAFAALGDSERAWELLTMINPINHATTEQGAATYKVEPYVVAADIYAVAPHIGRGGWTWYTGSAGWMYRLIVESLLGLNLEDDKLRFAPCIPADWESFKLHYRYRDTTYHISVVQSEARAPAGGVSVDGVPQRSGYVQLLNDGVDHVVEIAIQRFHSGNTPEIAPSVQTADG